MSLSEIQRRVDSMLYRIGPTLYEKTDLSRWTQEQLLRDLEDLKKYLAELQKPGCRRKSPRRSDTDGL